MRGYEDFYDSHLEEAIENLREAYEPSEEAINEEITDMYENTMGELADQEHERRRDAEMGL